MIKLKSLLEENSLVTEASFWTKLARKWNWAQDMMMWDKEMTSGKNTVGRAVPAQMKKWVTGLSNDKLHSTYEEVNDPRSISFHYLAKKNSPEEFFKKLVNLEVEKRGGNEKISGGKLTKYYVVSHGKRYEISAYGLQDAIKQAQDKYGLSKNLNPQELGHEVEKASEVDKWDELRFFTLRYKGKDVEVKAKNAYDARELANKTFHAPDNKFDEIKIIWAQTPMASHSNGKKHGKKHNDDSYVNLKSKSGYGGSGYSGDDDDDFDGFGGGSFGGGGAGGDW